MPKKVILIVIGIIILLAGMATASVYVSKKSKAPQKETEKITPQKSIITPTPLPTPSESKQTPSFETTESSEIDTSDWKTYRNEEYGFEVRYPSHYEISNLVYTNIGPAITSENVEIIFTDETSPNMYERMNKECREAVSIKNGVLVFKCPLGWNMDSGIDFEVFIPREKKLFRILFSTTKPGREREIDIFGQMLFSFRFLQ